MLALIQMAGLRELAFVCGDFDSVIEEAGDGDVVFCDPPYEPMPDKMASQRTQGRRSASRTKSV